MRQRTKPLIAFGLASVLLLLSLSHSSGEREVRRFPEVLLEARSAYVYDLRAGAALFAKNENVALALASLTKLISALVAVEQAPGLKGDLGQTLLTSSNQGIRQAVLAVAPAEDGGGGGAPARPEFRNLACGDHSIGRGGNGDVLLVYWRNLAEEGRNLSRNHLLAETYRTDDGDGALRCALPSFIVQRFREFAGERGAAAGPPKASRLVAVSIGETVLAFVPGEGYCVFDPEQERPEDQYRAFADESSCRTYLGPERLGRLREMMFTVAMGPGEKGVEGKEGRDERGRRELMDGGREKALAALHADIQAFLWESETVQILPDPTVVRDVP